VTDRATALQWKRCSEGQTWDGATCTGTATTHTWQQALQLADGATYAGHGDWRLPNLKEIASIMETACNDPPINDVVFPGTPSDLSVPPGLFWTSASIAHLPSYAWSIMFDGDDRHSGQDGASPKYWEHLVRLVRGGQPLGPMNDSGIDWCATATANFLACPVAGYPGQDAQYGRDVSHDDDADGHAGFSFAKLDPNGEVLPATASAWSCVRDGVTGLTWEVKTDDGGLRDKDWIYSWYNPDSATNGGRPGTPDGTDSCYDPDRCDTLKFVADVNDVGLCGASDWRLPTREELRSIADYSRFNPAIDNAWLGPTKFSIYEGESGYWSSSPYAPVANMAYAIQPYQGSIAQNYTFVPYSARLVRGRLALPFDGVGVWRSGDQRFRLDTNGNGQWDRMVGGDTLSAQFGRTTDVPVAGDWNGDGRDEIGVWRERLFLLDSNGNGQWDGATGGDTAAAFGLATDIPVTGDWNADGSDEIGVWRPNARQFLLDSNGNYIWDGTAGGDTLSAPFGLSTDLPVTGDWTGDGRDDIGVWRPSQRRFYLDTNGNGRWDGAGGADTVSAPYGLASDRPVSGDWNADGIDEIGVWRPSTAVFFLDTNGNDQWDSRAGGDTASSAFGLATDSPVTGRW
jgi:hypothetical protein